MVLASWALFGGWVDVTVHAVHEPCTVGEDELRLRTNQTPNLGRSLIVEKGYPYIFEAVLTRDTLNVLHSLFTGGISCT